jgi:hypothetical protein
VHEKYPRPLDSACDAFRWSSIAFCSNIQSISSPSTRWANVCWPPWHEEASKTIFPLSSHFSPLHLKMWTDLAKLQSDPQSFNCFEFNLFIFQFRPLTFDFLCFFLSNLILFFISIYFVFNFFFVEFDLHSYDCNSFYFEFSSWLIFFLQFHPLLFNFIELSYHIWCFFLSYF